MVALHRDQRSQLLTAQKERWKGEEQKRCARIRSGFKGLWDKINGRYWKNRKRNEQETWLAHQRDQKEREELFKKQMAERQNLQIQIHLLREKQEKERKALLRDLSHVNGINEPLKAKSPMRQLIKQPEKEKITGARLNSMISIWKLIRSQRFKPCNDKVFRKKAGNPSFQ